MAKTKLKKEMIFGVIGLGKLGLCLTSILGRIKPTVGMDINANLISELKLKKQPYDEKKLDEYLKTSSIFYTNKYEDLDVCDIIFCVVPTPSKSNGRFNNSYIINAIKKSKKNIKKCKLFVIVSTVMPGSTRKIKKFLPAHTKLCYNPEFIALGNTIENMEKPDVVLIGEEDSTSGELLEEIYKLIITNGAPIKRMSWESAEIAKISLNSYVTMKISFSNILGEICENFPYANVDDVTDILGEDSRIGKKFIKSAVPFGGPCFPRDNRAFSKIFHCGASFEKSFKKSRKMLKYSEITDEINQHQFDRIVDKCKNILQGNLKNKTISILGMGYKPGSELRFESPGEILKERLEKEGANVLEDSIYKSELLIIMMPGAFANSFEDLLEMRHIRVLDCWRDRPDLNQDGIAYYTLGQWGR